MSSILTYAVQYLPMPETKECIITVVLRVSPRSSFAYLLVWHERPATAFVWCQVVPYARVTAAPIVPRDERHIGGPSGPQRCCRSFGRPWSSP